MMNTILAENLVSFKELEQKIFAFVCELGREITQIMLESYDKELAEGRDKKIYRDKGTRNTSIKTVYGEVSYSRRTNFIFSLLLLIRNLYLYSIICTIVFIRLL